MRRALLLAALVASAAAAACDFDGAYVHFCDGNPACAQDAGVADASVPDGSVTPCTPGDPHDCPGAFCQNGVCVPIQCDPTDPNFSMHDGPSNCWYGQICTDQGNCE